ncbi:hypothetical protein B1207_02875 [Legionella quinlivanii]|uniref:Uncharacterized protein n=1 Tax=Legionella quinlivanii TaxID=45073 RepID=A0A364LM49_9GAMM|nr:DUF4435 domain-containing protein [Legionella quinlivanii]RAP37948.1 hypothetical protein B1207_02875 [Legionella quinlivanii]
MNISQKSKQIIILPEDKQIEVDRGLVIIGSNGSGKTRFGSWIDLKSAQNAKSHRISAQKSLNIPDNVRPMAIDKAMSILLCGHEGAISEQYQRYKSSHKWGNQAETILINDYEHLLVYLLSEHNERSVEYVDDSKKTDLKVKPPITKMDLVRKIWQETMPHRSLIIKSGNIQTCPITDGASAYNASQMSDGERVVFYLIGRCLSVPENSILIIDEPELHLHKSIQYALWNKIEKIRHDCLFIYLTHDVEFAASRAGYKKIWLKDYNGAKWTWSELEEGMDLPEELLFEVYGSRKKVLLVEGSNSSHDVQFYKNIFSDFLVRPCGSCENVITYTKTLRSNQGFHQLDVYGLIDKDRRTPTEITELEKHGIFTLSVAEVENLFITPEILKIVADHLELDYENKLQEIREFLTNELAKEVNIQVSEMAVQELKYRLSRLDLSCKTKTELDSKYSQLINAINVNTVYDELHSQLTQIIQTGNYEGLLSFYNRKALASRVGANFGLSKNELPALIIRLSNRDEYIDKFLSAISNYIPESLANLNLKEDKKAS